MTNSDLPEMDNPMDDGLLQGFEALGSTQPEAAKKAPATASAHADDLASLMGEAPAASKTPKKKGRKAKKSKTEKTPKASRSSLFSNLSFANLKISNKLYVGFGAMVALVVVVGIVSFIGSSTALVDLSRTKELRVPTASSSKDAKADMLEMLANIRGYLSLGDQEFLDGFNAAKQKYEAEVTQLETLSVGWTNPENLTRLEAINSRYAEWVDLPATMFALRDNPLENQPALKLQTEELLPLSDEILAEITALIDEQAQQEPSTTNTNIFKNMADFRGSFGPMEAALAGYIATGDTAFKDDYFRFLQANENAWNALNGQKSLLTTTQNSVLRELTTDRAAFLLIPNQLFEIVEGDRAREDLYILSSQAAPLAGEIVSLLDEMAENQDILLAEDVDEGTTRLAASQTQTLVGAGIAFLVAIFLVLTFQRNLGDPIVELAAVAQKLGTGDLRARSGVKTRDEVGELADQFNDMAAQLQTTLEGMESTISERTRELRERAIEMDASQRVTFAATERTSPDDFLELLVNLIQDQFDVYHTQIYLLDDKKENAVLRQSTGYAGRQLMARGHIIPMERAALVTTAIRENRPVVVPDVTKDAGWAANPLLPLTQSELVVPLRIEGEVLGALDIQDRVVNRFSQESAAVFEAMAEQATFLFENNELLERVTQQTAELERFTSQLRQVAEAANQLGTILDPEQLLDEAVVIIQSQFSMFNTHVFLIDEATQSLVIQSKPEEIEDAAVWNRIHRIPLGTASNSAARSARELQPIVVRDSSTEEESWCEPMMPGVRSELAIPLVVAGRILGVLVVLDENPNRFSTTEVDTLVTLAGQMASSMENARLFEAQAEVQRRLSLMVQRSPLAVIEWDTEFQVVDWNPAAENIFGYTREEALGRHAAGLIVPSEVKAIVDEVWQDLLTRRGGDRSTNDNVTKSGEQIVCEWYNTPLVDLDGNVFGVTSMVSDITERKMAEETIVQGDRLKSEFLANMSHELRTPLNSIIGYTDVLLMGLDGELDPEINADIQAIHDNGQHLLRIINDILDLAKIEAGRMALELSSVDIPALFEHTVKNNAGLVGKKDVKLVVDAKLDLPSVMADRVRLSQILNNLVSNAIKFTEKGTITLSSVLDGDKMSIKVVDTGTGISPDDMDTIFDEFQQADTSSTRAVEGTGLGLTITRRLVQMHGGTITVESELGKGTTFTVLLPLEAEVPAGVTVTMMSEVKRISPRRARKKTSSLEATNGKSTSEENAVESPTVGD